MKQEESKPGVVIDVSPDDEPDAANAEAAPPPAAGRLWADRGRAAAIGIAVLALLATGASAWLGYRGLGADLQALEQRIVAADDDQSALRKSLDDAATALREQREVLGGQLDAMEETRAAFRRQEAELAEETRRLASREADLRAAVADLRQRVGRSGSQWIVAEARYLLRVANYRVQLAGDAASARVALEIADQRLRDTRDPGWAPVREQIARDIARLDAHVQPDWAGIAARLTALIDRVPELPLTPRAADQQPVSHRQDDTVTSERSLDTLLDDLSTGFRDLVRVRRHEAEVPLPAVLAPEQRFFVHENLKLQLEASRLALLQRDQATFADGLAGAAAWLARYFDPADDAVQSLQRSLDELAGQQIETRMPDISGSLRAFRSRSDLPADAADGMPATP